MIALQTEEEKMHGLYVMKLVRSFCTSPREDKGILLFHVGSKLTSRIVVFFNILDA